MIWEREFLSNFYLKKGTEKKVINNELSGSDITGMLLLYNKNHEKKNKYNSKLFQENLVNFSKLIKIEDSTEIKES